MRFVDIAILAKDIHTKMDIDCSCKIKINILNEDSSQNTIETEIVNYFQDKIRIEVYSTQPQDDEVFGIYTRYNKDNYVLIVIDVINNLNECWKRFITTKELVHTILDKEESAYTCNIEELIDMLIENNPNVTFDDDIDSEYLAFFFALELLLPYCHNSYMTNKDILEYRIAEEFMVPEKMINFIRSDWYQLLRNKSYN
jgi:Zn-dependent peptidase ImmA (M78 family)